MSIDDYKYLWDGSEPDWTLQLIDHVVWRINFTFQENGPTKQEIITLRKIISSLRKDSLSEVYNHLKGSTLFQVDETYGNIEARDLITRALKEGLNAEIKSEQIGGYLPFNKEKSETLIIEDAELTKAVVEKMLQAGVQIHEVHVD